MTYEDWKRAFVDGDKEGLTNGGYGGKIKARKSGSLSADGTAQHRVHKIGSIDASNKNEGTYTEYGRTFVAGYDRHLAAKTGAATRKQNAFKNAQVTLDEINPATSSKIDYSNKKATVPPPVIKSSFVKAKTIEEAQMFAKQYIGERLGDKTFKGAADFKGISVNNANEINKALADVYDRFDIPKISGIKAIDPNSAKGRKIFTGSDAVMAYSPVEHGIYINKTVLKNSDTLSAYKKRSQEAWDTVMFNIDNLEGAPRDLAMRYKTAGRELVGDGSAHDYFIHEMGHHIQWEAFDAKTNNAVGSRMSRYAGKISGYATASKSEYFAESFVAYLKGEFDKIDPEYVSFVRGKAIDKSAENGIMLMRGKMSDVDVRKWYIEQNNKIPDLIDRSAPIETQARQACEMRNANRFTARELMADQIKRRELDQTDPIISFEELLEKKINDKGLSRDEALKDIIDTATKTRKSVNKMLGLEE